MGDCGFGPFADLSVVARIDFGGVKDVLDDVFGLGFGQMASSATVVQVCSVRGMGVVSGDRSEDFLGEESDHLPGEILHLGASFLAANLY